MHEHEQVNTYEMRMGMSLAWASLVITDELRMCISSYYSWVKHDHEQFLLMSSALAWAGINL